MPQWIKEQRAPAFLRFQNETVAQEDFGTDKFLWGNTASIDIVQLRDNEGQNCDRDLNLLFAGKKHLCVVQGLSR